MTGDREKLTGEIKARLNSPAWDYKIASHVISFKKKKSERFLTAGSFISTAAAAAAVFVLVIDLATGIPGSRFSEADTFAEIYYQLNSESASALYAATEIDYIINEAFPMR